MRFKRDKKKDLRDARSALLALKRNLSYVDVVFYYLSMNREMAIGGNTYQIARFLKMEELQVKRAISILDEKDILYLTEYGDLVMNPLFVFNGFDNKEKEKINDKYQDYREMKPSMSSCALTNEEIDIETGEVW